MYLIFTCSLAPSEHTGAYMKCSNWQSCIQLGFSQLKYRGTIHENNIQPLYICKQLSEVHTAKREHAGIYS